MDQFENPETQPTHLRPEKVASSSSPLINILAGVVLGVSLGWLIWTQLFSSPLDQVPWPERGLPLFVGRMMELKEALKETPEWERRLYSAMLLDSPNDLPLAISWYEELAANTSEPQIRVQLAILEGESGRIEQVRQRVAEWDGWQEPYPQFAQLLRIAYLNPSETTRDLNTKVIEEIDEPWFRQQLMARLFADDRVRVPSLGATKLSARSARMLVLVRLFAAITLFITIAGSIGLFFLRSYSRLQPAALRMGTAPIPPCWSGPAGTAVFIRSGAIFILLTAGGGILEGRVGFSVPIIWLCVSLMSILACLDLAHRYLFKPVGLGIREGFGLSVPKARRGQLLLWIASLLSAAALGGWGIVWISERLKLPIHWAESFDADFVWGSSSTVGLIGIHAVVFGPIFEELLFRGLLFATLRTKFDFGPAAILSAIMFSLIHGYGIAGFLSVAWTGVLWAWAYEKTGSLLPGVIAHGIHNFLWSSVLIAFLRG